jgi:hypothetical protein
LKTRLSLTVTVLLLALGGAAGQTASAQGKYPQWLVNAFMCIHSHEGSWQSNTGNGYYGGFQMNYDFMKAYGPSYLRRYGYAHNWTPAMQLEVAVRGWQDRGFRPWPNTRRMCGV